MKFGSGRHYIFMKFGSEGITFFMKFGSGGYYIFMKFGSEGITFL